MIGWILFIGVIIGAFLGFILDDYLFHKDNQKWRKYSC